MKENPPFYKLCALNQKFIISIFLHLQEIYAWKTTVKSSLGKIHCRKKLILNVPNVRYAKIFIDLLKQVTGKDSLCMTKLFREIL